MLYSFISHCQTWGRDAGWCQPTLGCEHRCPVVQACKHNEAMKMQTRTSEKPFLLKASHTDLPYSSSNPHNPVSRYLCLFTISHLSERWKSSPHCCQVYALPIKIQSNRVEPIKASDLRRERVFSPPCDLGRLMQLELFHSPLRSLCWPRDLWANNTESIIITME